MSTFQYQAMAEPVLVSAVAPATVNLEWFLQDPFVSRRRRLVQHESFSAVFVVSALPINADLVAGTATTSFRKRRPYLQSGQPIEPFIAAITTPRVTRSPGQISHEVDKDDGRSRKALQQISNVLNGLRGTGELQGTFLSPYLGYNPANVQHWGTIAPDSLADALDRIAAALDAAGFTP